METVTVSPKFQVVIPRAIREAMGIRPSQKIQVVQSKPTCAHSAPLLQM